jgi:hypothetical protein
MGYDKDAFIKKIIQTKRARELEEAVAARETLDILFEELARVSQTHVNKIGNIDGVLDTMNALDNNLEYIIEKIEQDLDKEQE